MKPIDNWMIYYESHQDEAARQAVFRQVWDHYQQPLIYFIQRFTGRHAEDIFQDIMLKVYENLDRYRPWYAFSTWLYTIARNHCLNWISRNRSSAASLASITAGQTADPESLLIGKETARRIEQFLESQKPDHQQMAFLRFYEGMPLKQIAGILKIPLGSIKSRLHLMKKEIQTILENENAI